jgi:hypothetical protein
MSGQNRKRMNPTRTDKLIRPTRTDNGQQVSPTAMEITNHQPDWVGPTNNWRFATICGRFSGIPGGDFRVSLVVIFGNPWYHSGRWSTLVSLWWKAQTTSIPTFKSLFWPQLTRYWPCYARIKLLVSLKCRPSIPGEPSSGPLFHWVSFIFGRFRCPYSWRPSIPLLRRMHSREF